MLLCLWRREPLVHYRWENSTTIWEISVRVPQRARNIYPVISRRSFLEKFWVYRWERKAKQGVSCLANRISMGLFQVG